MKVDFTKLLKRCLKLVRGDIVLVKGTLNESERVVLRQVSIETGIFFICAEGEALFDKMDDFALARMGLKRLKKPQPEALRTFEEDQPDPAA